MDKILENGQLVATDRHRPSPERVTAYFNLDRSQELMSGKSRLVPLEKDQWMKFTNESNWITDRPRGSYDCMLFADEFVDREKITQGWSVENHLRKAVKRPGAKPLFGGQNFAFAPGKNVLDIASGEALAILEYALDFPETTFIGIDKGYERKEEISLSQPGVQLTQDDWTELSSIPDQSIDTILSCQGIFMWGIPSKGEIDANVPVNHTDIILKAMSRISKTGTILRFDHHESDEKYLIDLLKQYGWQVEFFEQTAAAKKID